MSDTTTFSRDHENSQCDRIPTTSREHVITAINLSELHHNEQETVMTDMRPVLVFNSTTSQKLDVGRRIGRDGTPVLLLVDETAELCARHADALAGEAERTARDVKAQIEALGRGDLVAATRALFGLYGSLRGLAGSLGELHTALDELAHRAGSTGGAS